MYMQVYFQSDAFARLTHGMRGANYALAKLSSIQTPDGLSCVTSLLCIELLILLPIR